MSVHTDSKCIKPEKPRIYHPSHCTLDTAIHELRTVHIPALDTNTKNPEKMPVRVYKAADGSYWFSSLDVGKLFMVSASKLYSQKGRMLHGEHKYMFVVKQKPKCVHMLCFSLNGIRFLLGGYCDQYIKFFEAETVPM